MNYVLQVPPNDSQPILVETRYAALDFNVAYALTQESMQVSRQYAKQPVFTGSPLKLGSVPEEPVLYVLLHSHSSPVLFSLIGFVVPR